MSGPVPSVRALLGLAARDPRAAVRQIKAMALTPEIAWLAFFTVLVIELFFVHLLGVLAGPVEPAPDAVAPAFVQNPLLLSVVHGSIVTIMVFCVHWIGRAFGGTGRLEDAAASVALLLFALMVLQAGELLLIYVLPGLAAGVFLFNIVVFFWLLTMFVAELHGFQRPALVFGGIILSILGLAFGMTILLTVIGVSLGGLPNV